MKQTQVTVNIEEGNDVPDEVIVSAINDAVSFAENDGMWPHRFRVSVEAQ